MTGSAYTGYREGSDLKGILTKAEIGQLT